MSKPTYQELLDENLELLAENGRLLQAIAYKKSTKECREGCDVYKDWQQMEGDLAGLVLEKSHADDREVAEADGAKAFYAGKTDKDNPYTGTYTRPEVIIKGVNDESMQVDDWRKYDLELSWYNGWAAENSSNEKDVKIRELERDLTDKIAAVNTVTAIMEDLKAANHVLQNEKNDADKVIDQMAEVINSTSEEIQRVIDNTPFRTKNVKIKLKGIKEGLGIVIISKEASPEH